ncbi:hypothetical protein KBD81_01850 [Candidatus Woesebacteria bacterium]|nr:hypothetical protein [Candidatus Woesebacteria bacterium]
MENNTENMMVLQIRDARNNGRKSSIFNEGKRNPLGNKSSFVTNKKGK